MQVCQNCGETIEPHQSFCKNCGTKIIIGPELNKDTSSSTNPVSESQMRSNIPKKAILSPPIKWAIATALILAIALFGTHTYLANLYKPEKTVTRFEQAVKQKDYTSLRKILVQNGTKLDISDKDLASYIAFLTKDKSLNQIGNELNQAAEGMKYYKKVTPVTDNSSNKLLELEKGGKLLGIYQQYVINVYPFTIKAETNADNTDIYINGEKAKQIKKSNDTVTIGQFLPGDYSLKAVYKGDFVSLNSQKKVDFTDAEYNTVTTKVNLNGHFVSISSNGDGAEIFANGKDTGKKTGDFDSFGPVPIDGSVELYAVMNRESGPIKSNPVKITSDGEIFLEFKEIADEQKRADEKQAAQDALNQYGGEYDSPQQKMETFMNEYISASMYAINQRDFSQVESYLTPNGKEYTDSKNYISYLSSKGITESLIDLTVINVESTDTGFKVKTNEEYNISYGDGSMKDKTFVSNYTLVGDDSGLKIMTLDSTNELSSNTVADGSNY